MEKSIVVATFYKFVPVKDAEVLREALLKLCSDNEVCGTILLAEEGINSTIAGSRLGVDAVLNFLRADSRFNDLSIKESFADSIPFKRMKVRVKQEIVTFKVEGINPNELVGTYVEPKDWNDLISDPDVVVIDTRNDFEAQVGTFKGAINPQTESFHEFPDFVEARLNPQQHKKVAMFCTGGIRCEKATGYMLQQGFEEVYHLNGGILRYLENVSPDESLWDGECFVFDERVAVNHALEPGKTRFCEMCKALLIDEESCPNCGK
jgi:UPF0176 protein